MFVQCMIRFIVLALALQYNTVFAAESAKEPQVHKVNNLILIGPPASGKGTQAKAISQRYQIPTISTGDLLRAQVQLDTPRARKIKKIMQEGQLVPTEIVVELLKSRIEQEDAKNGFILDGFPRSLDQAKSLERIGINIHHVIVLEVPDDIIVERISGRWIHAPSGRTYHLKTNPPKKAGVDDITQEPLVQRDDDTPEVIKKRLATFREQTLPVIEFYKSKAESTDEHLHVFIIDSTQPIEKVQAAIAAALKQ